MKQSIWIAIVVLVGCKYRPKYSEVDMANAYYQGFERGLYKAAYQPKSETYIDSVIQIDFKYFDITHLK